jgi:hypothetical protein
MRFSKKTRPAGRGVTEYPVRLRMLLVGYLGSMPRALMVLIVSFPIVSPYERKFCLVGN